VAEWARAALVAPMVGAQQVGCMQLEQTVARSMHVEFLLERIAQLAALVAAVVGLALEPCPMWAPAKEGTSRRRPTSTLVAAVISTPLALEEISRASLQRVAS